MDRLWCLQTDTFLYPAARVHHEYTTCTADGVIDTPQITRSPCNMHYDSPEQEVPMHHGIIIAHQVRQGKLCSLPSKQETLQCWANVGRALQMLGQHLPIIGSMLGVF